MDSKPIWLSKTFWVSVLTFLVSMLGFLQGHEWIAENPTVVAILGMALGILNIVLRSITDTAVLFGRKKPKDRLNY